MGQEAAGAIFTSRYVVYFEADILRETDEICLSGIFCQVSENDRRAGFSRFEASLNVRASYERVRKRVEKHDEEYEKAAG